MAVVPVLTIVVRRGCRLGHEIFRWAPVVINDWTPIVVAVVGVVLWVVRKRPKLRFPACFSHLFQNLLLLCPSRDRHFLQIHIYVNVVHSYISVGDDELRI